VFEFRWFPLRHDEILEWVEAHREALPTNVAELAMLPVAFRRVIVNFVPHEQRTRFWREHLESFLGPESALTAEQRTFVEGTISALPDVFGNALPEAQKRIRSMEEGMRGLFTRQEAAAMFGMVGPPEPEGGCPLPPGTRLTPEGGGVELREGGTDQLRD
jgi:hypothetical protein